MLSFKTKCKRNLTHLIGEKKGEEKDEIPNVIKKLILYLLTCDVKKMNILKKKLTCLSLTSLKNEKNIYIK